MISAFCQICKNATPTTGTERHPGLPTKKWRMVLATHESGEWVYKEDSGAKIVVCPTCKVPGEPEIPYGWDHV